MKEYRDDFMGPLPRDGYRTNEMTRTRCGNIPPAPPGVDLNANIAKMWGKLDPWWFKDQVKNKGPMDYKQRGPRYQDFGNFNYGAVGHNFGFPDSTLHKEAGRAQQAAGTSRPGWGTSGSRYNPSDQGVWPYGDDPDDADLIRRGIEYCKCMLGEK